MALTHYWRCPRCGYTEPVAWRGSKFHPDWQVGDFDEFKRAYPELGERLAARAGEQFGVVSGDYFYWRQSGRSQHLVHRIPLVIYRANLNHCRGKGSYAESLRTRTLKHPYQRTL